MGTLMMLAGIFIFAHFMNKIRDSILDLPPARAGDYQEMFRRELHFARREPLIYSGLIIALALFAFGHFLSGVLGVSATIIGVASMIALPITLLKSQAQL